MCLSPFVSGPGHDGLLARLAAPCAQRFTPNTAPPGASAFTLTETSFALTGAFSESLLVPRATPDFLSRLLRSAWQARVKWGHPGQPEASLPLLPLASLQVTKRVCFSSHPTKVLFPVHAMQLLQNGLEGEPRSSCLSRRRRCVRRAWQRPLEMLH